MPLTSPIVPYDPGWPEKYLKEKQKIIPAFGAALVDIHHVGSTSIPNLAAKAEIDILVIVDCQPEPSPWTDTLNGFGYRQGRDLDTGHQFYKRDEKGLRTHKIHVCLTAHPHSAEMLVFRDYLRKHAKTRIEYEQLKLEAERANKTGIAEYLEAKTPFIRRTLFTAMAK